ncbi:MAG TPA: DUF222 domain-containing protein, partial [Jiangellaceae bacterium]|nr:DUF222 domain-containing protein [Jiangellaceae bacterium]
MFDTVVRLGDRLAMLVDGLDADAVSGPAAGELWAALDRVERLAAAGKMLLARRLGETHVPHQAGVKTAAEALARRSGTTVGSARNALDTSARLPQLPRVEAAVRRGDLSTAQAAVVASAAAADPRAERRLLDLAARTSMPELREEAARVRAAADPDPEATNTRLQRDRALRRYTDPDGAWTLVAKGTPQAGAAIDTALDPIIDTLFRKARQAGRRESHQAYAFDALLTLAEGATGAGGLAATQTGSEAAADASEAAADMAASSTTTYVATDAGPSADAAREPTLTPARRPPRPNPRYLALLRVDVEALRRGAVAGGELCEITGVGPVPVSVARDLLGES